MAYTSLIRSICTRCGKVATYEVFNSRNASHGKYCKKHADGLVLELNRLEALDLKNRNDTNYRGPDNE